MRPSRFTLLFLSLFLLSAVCSFAQAAGDDAIAHAAIATGRPDMGDRGVVDAQHVSVSSIGSLVFDADTGKVVGGSNFASFNGNAKASAAILAAGSDDKFDIDDPRPNVSTIDQLDTIATFDGAFVAQAGPDVDNDFRFTMVGNDPKLGGTTVYPGPILETSWELLNADGSVFKDVPFA